MSTPEQLLDELVGRWTRREPLEVDELLARAGPRADELATLIDAFLERAPRREPTPDALAFVRSLDEPPVLALRVRRRLTREAVVGALIAALGLDPDKRVKVAGYYHELETGLLPTAGVDGSVWEALRDVLGANVQALASRAVPKPPFASPAYLRERNLDMSSAEPAGVVEDHDAPSAPPEPDEIDRLFIGSR